MSSASRYFQAIWFPSRLRLCSSHHPQTSLTRCTFPVLYPVPAPERGPRWQTHAQRRNLGTSVRRPR